MPEAGWCPSCRSPAKQSSFRRPQRRQVWTELLGQIQSWSFVLSGLSRIFSSKKTKPAAASRAAAGPEYDCLISYAAISIPPPRGAHGSGYAACAWLAGEINIGRTIADARGAMQENSALHGQPAHNPFRHRVRASRNLLRGLVLYGVLHIDGIKPGAP